MNFINFLYKLTLGGSKESSKRFIALYVGIFLITYIVLRFTNHKNLEIVLAELIAFVLALLGIAAYEGIKRIQNNKNEPENEN